MCFIQQPNQEGLMNRPKRRTKRTKRAKSKNLQEPNWDQLSQKIVAMESCWHRGTLTRVAAIHLLQKQPEGVCHSLFIIFPLTRVCTNEIYGSGPQYIEVREYFQNYGKCVTDPLQFQSRTNHSWYLQPKQCLTLDRFRLLDHWLLETGKNAPSVAKYLQTMSQDNFQLSYFS